MNPANHTTTQAAADARLPVIDLAAQRDDVLIALVTAADEAGADDLLDLAAAELVRRLDNRAPSGGE